MRILLPDAEITYIQDFISYDESIEYLEQLLSEVNWQQNKIKMFGKVLPLLIYKVTHVKSLRKHWE